MSNITETETGVGQFAERDPRRWWVLAVMSVGTLIVFLDSTIINTAIPNISSELSASTSELQWVVDSYVLVLAGLLMLGGTIGDRYGRKRWMNYGLVLFGVGSVIGGLAASIETLIVARAVQGLGAALVLPATLSIITNVFDRDERPKAIAIWTAIGGLGVGFGPAIGGFLVDEWDYSAAFWVHIPVLVLAGLGMYVVQESRDHRDIGLDVPGALTGTVAIFAFVYGVIQGNEAGWTSAEIVASFTIAAISLAAFAVIETRAQHPMLPLSFFKQRDFSGAVIVLGVLFFAGIGLFFFMTQFFQLVQGRSAFEAGSMILPNAVTIVVGSMLAQQFGPKLGPRKLVTFALIMMGGAIASLSTLTETTGTWTIVGIMMVFGFGWGLAAQPLTDTVMAAVPVEDAGIGSAVNDVSRELGSALGIAVIGTFVSRLYRNNVEENLEGQVPDEVVEVAGEGIGVAQAFTQGLEPELAQTTFTGAKDAFVDAMTSGLWLSVAMVGVAVIVAISFLPDQAREEQVTLDEAEPQPSFS